MSKLNKPEINYQNLTPFYTSQPVTLIINKVPYSDRNSRESVKEKKLPTSKQSKTIPHPTVCCKLKLLFSNALISALKPVMDVNIIYMLVNWVRADGKYF